MVKVEPKVHFANERTFLSWMHMSVSARSRHASTCLLASVAVAPSGKETTSR